jgi:uncharacterized protein
VRGLMVRAWGVEAVAVYSADAQGERRLRLHAAEIDPATQAALLRLDPIADREEYAALAELLATGDPVIFRQGEALIAGKISPQPALLRFGARITEEGGADVPATWAAAR